VDFPVFIPEGVLSKPGAHGANGTVILGLGCQNWSEVMGRSHVPDDVAAFAMWIRPFERVARRFRS